MNDGTAYLRSPAMVYQSLSRRGGLSARERSKVIRPCEVRGCPKPRAWTTSRCQRHNAKNTWFGTPTARKIHKYEWGGHKEHRGGYLKAVHQIFKKNKGHPALVAADEFMAELLTPGPER